MALLNRLVGSDQIQQTQTEKMTDSATDKATDIVTDRATDRAAGFKGWLFLGVAT